MSRANRALTARLEDVQVGHVSYTIIHCQCTSRQRALTEDPQSARSKILTFRVVFLSEKLDQTDAGAQRPGGTSEGGKESEGAV